MNVEPTHRDANKKKSCELKGPLELMKQTNSSFQCHIYIYISAQYQGDELSFSWQPRAIEKETFQPIQFKLVRWVAGLKLVRWATGSAEHLSFLRAVNMISKKESAYA